MKVMIRPNQGHVRLFRKVKQQAAFHRNGDLAPNLLSQPDEIGCQRDISLYLGDRFLRKRGRKLHVLPGWQKGANVIHKPRPT